MRANNNFLNIAGSNASKDNTLKPGIQNINMQKDMKFDQSCIKMMQWPQQCSPMSSENSHYSSLAEYNQYSEGSNASVERFKTNLNSRMRSSESEEGEEDEQSRRKLIAQIQSLKEENLNLVSSSEENIKRFQQYIEQLQTQHEKQLSYERSLKEQLEHSLHFEIEKGALMREELEGKYRAFEGEYLRELELWKESELTHLENIRNYEHKLGCLKSQNQQLKDQVIRFDQQSSVKEQQQSEDSNNVLKERIWRLQQELNQKDKENTNLLLQLHEAKHESEVQQADILGLKSIVEFKDVIIAEKNKQIEQKQMRIELLEKNDSLQNQGVKFDKPNYQEFQEILKCYRRQLERLTEDKEKSLQTKSEDTSAPQSQQSQQVTIKQQTLIIKNLTQQNKLFEESSQQLFNEINRLQCLVNISNQEISCLNDKFTMQIEKSEECQQLKAELKKCNDELKGKNDEMHKLQIESLRKEMQMKARIQTLEELASQQGRMLETEKQLTCQANKQLQIQSLNANFYEQKYKDLETEFNKLKVQRKQEDILSEKIQQLVRVIEQNNSHLQRFERDNANLSQFQHQQKLYRNLEQLKHAKISPLEPKLSCALTHIQQAIHLIEKQTLSLSEARNKVEIVPRVSFGNKSSRISYEKSPKNFFGSSCHSPDLKQKIQSKRTIPLFQRNDEKIQETGKTCLQLKHVSSQSNINIRDKQQEIKNEKTVKSKAINLLSNTPYRRFCVVNSDVSSRRGRSSIKINNQL